MKNLMYLWFVILLISTVGCGELILEEDDTTSLGATDTTSLGATDTTGTVTDTTGTVTDTTKTVTDTTQTVTDTTKTATDPPETATDPPEVVTEEVKMIIRANKTCEEKTADQPLGQELADAVFEKNLPEVKRLVAAGANINHRDTDRGGKTPLMLAGRVEYVTALIAAEGLCINLQDPDKKTALLHALSSATLLLPAKPVAVAQIPGTNPNIKDNDGNTAILLALRTWSKPIVEAVLAIGDVDMQVVNKQGNTALHQFVAGTTSLASPSDIDRLFELVRGKQEDVNTLNNADMTPLMIVADNIRLGGDYVSRLLAFPNIDGNKQNSEGNTALHFVVQKTVISQPVRSLTSFAGAKINLCNRDGKTAYALLQERITKIEIIEAEIVTIKADIVTLEAEILALEAENKSIKRELITIEEQAERDQKNLDYYNNENKIKNKKTKIRNKRKEIGEKSPYFTALRRRKLDGALRGCNGALECGEGAVGCVGG